MSQFIYLLFTEIMMVLRDRRSLVLSLILPLILSPLFTYFSISNLKESLSPGPIPVAVQGDPAIVGAVKQSFSEMNLTVVDGSEGSKKPAATITIAAATAQMPTAPAKSVPYYMVNIGFDSSEQASSTALIRIKVALDALSAVIARDQLVAAKLPPEVVTPFQIKTQDQGDKNAIPASIIGISLLVAIGMWPMLGSLNAAMDTAAGERERKSLEPLLATRTSPWTIVAAKFGGVMFSSLLGGAVGVGSSVLVYLFYGRSFVQEYLPLSRVLLLLPVSIAIVLVASAAGLFLSFQAKSTKEAGLYLAPLQLFFPVALMFSEKLELGAFASVTYAIPLLNVIMLVKLIVHGQPLGFAYLSTAISSLVVMLFFLWLTARTIKRERILE